MNTTRTMPSVSLFQKTRGSLTAGGVGRVSIRSVCACKAASPPPRRKVTAARTDTVETRLNSVLVVSRKLSGNRPVALPFASARRGGVLFRLRRSSDARHVRQEDNFGS